MPATGFSRYRPRWTLRLRLTLLYGGLLLAAGAGLLAIVYGLVAQEINKPVMFSTQGALVVGRSNLGPELPPTLFPVAPPKGAGVFFDASSNGVSVRIEQVRTAASATVKHITEQDRRQLQAQAARFKAELDEQRPAELDTLPTRSGLALVVMAFVSIGLGWLVAGRALRPVRTMSNRARGISETNLHERLALSGPNDELKELGETFDALLARLEGAFESQRRFVANASHGLRTPITLSRTLMEVALADPNADLESLPATCRRVLAAGEQQEGLIEALLTLARSQRGVGARENLDLGAITGEVVRPPWSNG